MIQVPADSFDVDKVSAVRIGDDRNHDGWHECTRFSFYGKGDGGSLTSAGASWVEPSGCSFFVPLPSILGLRMGTPPPEEPEPEQHLIGRPNLELQTAVKWLESALEDGFPRPAKILKADAQGEANIHPRMLMRAWSAIGAKSVCMRGIWHWQLERLTDEVETEDPKPPSESEESRMESAKRYLRTRLRDGLTHPAKSIQEHIGWDSAVSADEIARAAEKIGVRAECRFGVWYWTLDTPQQSELIQAQS